MRRVLKKIRWRLEYGALLVLFYLARSLPWPRLVGWGRWLGRFVYHVLPIRRRVVLENLQAAFGAERSAAEIEGIARDFYAHLGTTLLEFCAFRNMSAENIRAVTSLENVEFLEECRARGKGALIVSGHYGNWELLGAAATCRSSPGFPRERIQDTRIVALPLERRKACEAGDACGSARLSRAADSAQSTATAIMKGAPFSCETDFHHESARSLLRTRAPTTTSEMPAQCIELGTSPSNGMAARALITGVSERKGTVRLNGDSCTERMKSTLASAFIVIDATAGGQ